MQQDGNIQEADALENNVVEDDNQQGLINPLENEEQPNNEANESVTNTDHVDDFDEQQ